MKTNKSIPIYCTISNRIIWKILRTSAKIKPEAGDGTKSTTDTNTFLFLWIISDQNV